MIIVTVVRNDLDGLRRTINSLFSQVLNSPISKIIIVDGESFDGSFEYAESVSQEEEIVQVFQKNPDGIYEAMNFALEYIKSVPDYQEQNILFLNSGDFLISSNALVLLDQAATNNGWATGRAIVSTYRDFPLSWIPDFGKDLFGANFNPNRFWIPHQALAINLSLFRVIGNFRLDLRLAADYELICRTWKMFGPPVLVDNAFIGQLHVGLSNVRTYSAHKEKNSIASELGFIPTKLSFLIRFKWWVKELLFTKYPLLNPNLRAQNSVDTFLGIDKCHSFEDVTCLWCAYNKFSRKTEIAS